MKIKCDGYLFLDPATGQPMELTQPCRVAGRLVYDTDSDGAERLRMAGDGPWTLVEEEE